MTNGLPLLEAGRRVEVEGLENEEEERSLKGWCQVRRKTDQEEKGVATVTRGWEEFKNKFPYLAHTWRLKLSSKSFKAEMKLSDEELERKDRERERWANKHEVKKWLSWVVSRRCFIED